MDALPLAHSFESDSPNGGSDACDVSIIVPIFNEEDNVKPLYEELNEVMSQSGLDYELVFVDDGSKDKSIERLRAVCASDPRATIIQLRRNFGQTPAMAAGIDNSRGRVLVPMDGDLQNDPHDIPKLISRLDHPERFDIVSGWRKNRQDKWANRKLPSRMANWIIRKSTGVQIHDFGCTMKAYRREVLGHIDMYSELHRFMPALAVWHGAKITEEVVNHRPRIHGVTKYDLRRSLKVLLDLVTVKFLGSYATKPLYFFGKFALLTTFLCVVCLGVAVAQKYGFLLFSDGHINLNRNVLVQLSALLFFFSVQCVLFGMLSELLVRIYHQAQGRATYRIRNIFSLKAPSEPGTRSQDQAETP
jgi:glycosyltransferase involved in cell wall biosynthesis